jgi:hypothetical protein
MTRLGRSLSASLPHRGAVWLLVAAAGLFHGCAPAAPDPKALVRAFNDANGKRLVNFYSQYQMEQGRGPKDEAELRKFILAKSPAALEEMGVSAGNLDGLFVSERDGQPFFIRYGAAAGGGRQALVFESQGSGGTVAVFFAGPKVVYVPAAEVEAYKVGGKDEQPATPPTTQHRRGVLVSLLAAAVITSAEGASTPDAGQQVMIRPEPTDDLLTNPGMGWETFGYPRPADNHLPDEIPSTIQYVRLGWGKLEPQPGTIDTAFLKGKITESRRTGQQLALRVKCCNPDKRTREHPTWLGNVGGRELLVDFNGGPADILIPDMDDPVVLDRHVDFIRRLGATLDGHPGVAHIDLGSIGWWGEWHMTRCKAASLPSLESRQRVIDAYMSAFRKTPLLMLIGAGECTAYAVKKGAGWRADSLGDMGSFASTWNHMRDIYPAAIRTHGLENAWRRAPVAFEPPHTLAEFVEKGWPARHIFNYALALHGSTFNGKSAPLPDDPAFRDELRQFLRRLGYRLVLEELAHPTSVQPGASLDVTMKWRNVGSAPCYRPYRLAYRLTGRDGFRTVIVGGVTVDQWLPGSVELFTEEFLTSAPDLPPGPLHDVTDRFQIPADAPEGECELAIGVVDVKGERPVVQLGIEGRSADGWYPLSRVHVGRDGQR